ncbi:hypothetical protein [Streptomyces hesseae]|uniref:Uncharacterized protein n=1 Tax=Streptomyces hesseae TaxID=3075519 RepID=A0ABU2SMW4_9ACTN|nr:hypothetical protein [Streptomyces sp. DSM 40473]MDT0450313.1 hypothetical protein [Streptomyces sp. DSM 40473]
MAGRSWRDVRAKALRLNPWLDSAEAEEQRARERAENNGRRDLDKQA